MKTDYPELEGKEIRFHNGHYWSEGKVSGCNYHIGISIENEYHYLLCLNGKKSPIYKKCKNPMPRYLYRKFFHQIVKQIQEGSIEPNIIFTKVGFYIPDNGNPKVTDCPYGQ